MIITVNLIAFYQLYLTLMHETTLLYCVLLVLHCPIKETSAKQSVSSLHYL